MGEKTTRERAVRFLPAGPVICRACVDRNRTAVLRNNALIFINLGFVPWNFT